MKKDLFIPFIYFLIDEILHETKLVADEEENNASAASLSAALAHVVAAEFESENLNFQIFG